MSVTPIHRDHDELLIVRAAEQDGVDPIDARLADEQLAECADCRALFADIQAIRASTNASVLRVPERPRSFRVSPDDLERLGVPAWRRWLARFGAPSFDIVRPLAGAVAGIGIAVIVLGQAGSVALPAARDLGGPAAGGASHEVQAPAAAPVPSAAGSSGDRTNANPGTTYFGSAASPAATGAPSAAAEAASGPPESVAHQAPGTGATKATDSGGVPAPNAPLPIGAAGAVVLLAGIGVLLLQTAARRMAGR